MRSRALAAVAAAALLLTLVPAALSAAVMSPTTGPNTGGTVVSISGASAGSFNLGTRVSITCGTTTPYQIVPTSVSGDSSALTFVTPSVAPYVGACTVATVNPAISLPDFVFTGTAPPGPTTKDDCKDGDWQSFTDPAFKNQGECILFVK